MFLRGSLILIFSLLSFVLHAQKAHTIMVGGALDVAKTDYDSFLKKAQFAAEGHYFFTPQITGSAGVDYWTGGGASLVLGGRWYPSETFFTRVRGLIGQNDFSIGAGWHIQMDEAWRFEAIGDFYFKGEFAIRIGVMHALNF